MAITHETSGIVRLENSKLATAVVPMNEDGSVSTPGTPSVAGTGINVATTSTAIASTAIDVQVIAATPNLRLMGFSIQENAGAAASFVLRNGTAASDTPLFYCTLGTGESRSEWFGPQGKIAAAGVYLDRVTGTVIGQIDTVVVA